MYESEEDWDNDDNEVKVKKPKAKNYHVESEHKSEREDKYERKHRSGNQERRSNHHDYNQDMDIPNSCFGMLIGRGGSNIQRLQSEYNVRIDLDKTQGVVKVGGRSEHNVNDAINDIKSVIDTAQERDDAGGRGPRSGDNRNNRDPRSFGERNNYDSSSSYIFTASDDRNDDKKMPVIDWAALNEKAEVERKIRWAQCPPLTKNFYKEAPEVKNLPPEDVQTIRMSNNNTTVSRVFKDKDATDADEDIPNPIWNFDQCFGDYPDLMEEIRKQGFQNPSPIQAQAWPILLKGEDMIGIAQTGTGKTLAFLFPAMIHTEYQSIPRSERDGPNVLILAPTRELALQIEKEVNKYAFRGMKALCIYGGGDRKLQIQNMRQGAEIIICTPGRLNDLIQANVIKVESITYLVLDEADRMLDMGFEPQIRKVLLDIRPDRQTVMTSATWPAGVRRLAQQYMNNPIQVYVGSLDLAATHSVEQVIEIIDEEEKYDWVLNFVKRMSPHDKAIIFCGRKTRADDLSSDLTLAGLMTQCIHGSRDQADREQAISDITSGEVKILIATDVASRGLDIDDISYVINYDFPRNIEEYVHRVGRTGRAGRSGMSISLLTRSDWGMAKELIAILEEAEQEVPRELRQMAERFTAMKQRRAQEDAMGGGRQRDHRRNR